MTTPTHLLIGTVIAKAALLTGAPVNAQHIYTVAIVSASIPDIDVLYYGVNPQHHKSLLHKPIFWVSLFILWFGVKQYILVSASSSLLTLISIGLWSHFLLDTGNYTTGVQWLWPFSKKIFHYFPFADRPKTAKKRWQICLHHPTFIFELTLIFGSLLFLRFF